MPSNVRPLTGKGKAYNRQGRVEIIGRVLTFFSAGYIILTMLCSVVPSSSHTSSSAAGPSYRSSRSRSKKCDPFSLPGWVQWSIASSEFPSWRTFDASCTTSNLMSALISTLNIEDKDPNKIAPHQIHKLTSSLNVDELNTFFTNRTVLLIGDHKVDHAMVSHFCSLTGHHIETVDKEHPWGNSLNTVPPRHGFTPIDRNGPLAHYCYLPEYDFLLTSVYSYGADVAESWKGEGLYNAPSLFEDRVTDLYQPYFKAMASSSETSPALPKPRVRAEPDLIFFNSGLWDLARWARQDIDTGVGLIENLSEERIFWWRARMVDMLTSIRKAWKKPRIVWRDTHFPLATEATTVESFLGIEGQPRKNHPLYHANRIAQLNQAQRSVLEAHGEDVTKGERQRSSRLPSDVVGVPFAQILMGQDQSTDHPLVPSQLPCGALFAEVMLWNLRDALAR
ncbi:hypothetical protein BCV70DRAFT_46044 [Testicularia cyperi]|uniref:Uncharacterized protein n=1 Tax=Testicularia cyperi TaxID=1882483 RepID=A0A317XJ63_9BASI|nr:hypothetical protein BCV70DRAFT_46044 [Testicularia cyperi]